MSYGVHRRRGSDPALLWPWCRPAATAPIAPLAWEPPCAMGVALEKKKKEANSACLKVAAWSVVLMILNISVKQHRGQFMMAAKVAEESGERTAHMCHSCSR